MRELLTFMPIFVSGEGQYLLGDQIPLFVRVVIGDLGSRVVEGLKGLGIKVFEAPKVLDEDFKVGSHMELGKSESRGRIGHEVGHLGEELLCSTPELL